MAQLVRHVEREEKELGKARPFRTVPARSLSKHEIHGTGMKIVNPPTSSGYTIFCDDIRREDNGKYFFIPRLLSRSRTTPPKLPIVLPTFVAFVNYGEFAGESTTAVRGEAFRTRIR